jgi:hypothetical protein
MKHDFRDEAVSRYGKCRNFHFQLIYRLLHCRSHIVGAVSLLI